MIRNYLKIAWRNVTRQKAFTIINVGGLALGITCCLFIFLWVNDERGMDAGQNDVFAVYQTVHADGKTTGTYTTPVKVVDNKGVFVLEDLPRAVPEVKALSFYATGYELPWGHAETFRAGDKTVKMEGSRAGRDFFSMLRYPLLEGSPSTALGNVRGIAISRKMAGIFFGSPGAAMGKTLRYENNLDFIVTAVFEDVPASSSLHFDFLFNWEAHKTLLHWASGDFKTFVKLAPGADPVKVGGEIDHFLQTRLDQTGGVRITAGLQSFGDQYLYNRFVNGQPTGGRVEYVRIFSGIALFILVIACINFMNLATARSVKRAKEVGLRKVIGSSRAHLIGQFFCEALFFSFLAMVLSAVLLYLFLPLFNQVTGKQIGVPQTRVSFWLSLAGISIITGLVAGVYPALYLSGLQPIRTVKGHSTATLRKTLTVFQFALSIFLIIATLVIVRQTRYTEHTDLGYDRQNLLYIRVEGALSQGDKYLLFKNRVSVMPGIDLVDRSSEAPHAMDFVEKNDIHWEGQGKNELVGFKPASVGFDFISLMNLKIVQGRDFSRLNPSDSTDAFMVNEEAVKEMGMKDPIGKWVSAWDKRGHIIAILKDYHTQSLREPIKPVILDVKENEYFGMIIVRVKPGQTREALASLRQVYGDINPDYPFTWQFVDEAYKQLYISDQVMSRLLLLFAVLAIGISCLGLFGLALFSAEQRVKEIGVRKVLGATMGQLLALFTQDFMKLVGIAFCIAAPLAWFCMNSWLQDFAYRVPVSWWIFALAGFSAGMIALVTVGGQAFRAALANPVESLRTE